MSTTPAIPDEYTPAEDVTESMTADEIAALEAPDEDDDDEGAKPAVTEDDDEPEDDAVEPGAATVPAAAEADPEPEEEPEEQEGRQPGPLLRIDVPADAAEQLAAIKAEKDALRAKFDDGDVTAKDFYAQQDALDDKREALRTILTQADIAQKMAQAQAIETWHSKCDAFLEAHPEIEKTPLRRDTFNGLLVAVNSNPDFVHLSDTARLNLTLKQWGEGLGIEVAKVPIRVPVVEKKPKRVIPPTLGALPAAGVDALDADSGKFAVLDRLSSQNKPLEYEAAFDRLSPADQEEYLRRS